MGVDPKNATFVAVTSRRWDSKKKTAWCAARKKQAKWLDVRAYGAVNLEAWRRDCPTIGVWVAERLRVMPVGMQSMEEVWERWRTPLNLLCRWRPAGREIAGIHAIVADSGWRAPAHCGAN